ncbi:hypothetical protein ACQ86N_16075 [Puia sp. P3]|uniref:hypothetical protein n=1 Tax=Puia sp. P3 TaxID=3423952 RepID=UPI003D67C57D
MIPFAYDNFRHVNFNIIGDSLVYSNESTGSTEYNLHTGQVRTYLPGTEVSGAFRDDEGNTWFTTVGRGLYRLNSTEFRNISLKQPGYTCSVHSILRLDNELVVGSNRNSIYRYSIPGMESLGQKRLNAHEKTDRIHRHTGQRKLVFGTDFTIEVRASNRRDSINARGVNVKSARLINGHYVLFASSLGAFTLDIDSFGALDTLLTERSTAVFNLHDTVYVGTLNGLYRVTGRGGIDRKQEFMGRNIPCCAAGLPLLQPPRMEPSGWRPMTT